MRPHPMVKCSKPLASNASAAPLDVVKMKSALGALGLYEAPEWGVSQFPDAALFDAIRAFQKAQGLKVDGAIKPGGETEAALSQAMNPRRSKAALQATAQALQSLGRGGDELLAHITPEEAALLHTVTDGASVNPHTGLLEFNMFGGFDRVRDKVRDAQNNHGRGQGDGGVSYDPSADQKANQNGSNAQTDPDNHGRGQGSDATGGATGSGANADSADGTANGGKGGPTRKEDTTKSQLGRSARVAGRQAGGNSLTDSFLETNAPEDEDAQDWNSGLLGEETSAPKATPAVDPDAVKNDKPAPAPKTKGGVPTPEEYNKNLATKTGWDRFVYGTKYGYLNNPTPASTAAKQKDPFARPSGQDLIRGRSIGYNDFLKGGLYGPYEGEPTTGPVNYAERRARWNAANPDIADSTFGNTSLGSGPGTKDTNNLGALTRKNVNPEGVVVDTELNTVFDADAQAAEKEHRQRMADAAKARQRTKYAAAWQRELDKPRALQKSPQQFAKDYQRSYGITSGYAPLGAEPVARGSAPQENVRNGLLMDLNELTKLIGPDSLAPQAKVPGVQVAFAPAITATPYATAALLEALALAGVLGLKAKRDAERRLLAEDDPLRDPAPGYGPPAQPEGWVETYPQASPDILRSTPPSVPGTPLTPNFEGYPDQSEELNKPQIVDARKDDLEKVDYLADHHDIDRAKLSDALHDLKDYYGYGGKSVHIDRNTLDVREKKGGRYIDNLENWIN